MGIYKICWKIEDDGLFKLKIEIPFGARAELILPNAQKEAWNFGIRSLWIQLSSKSAADKDIWHFKPDKRTLAKKGMHWCSSSFGIDANAIPAADSTIVEIKHMPFISITDEKLKELDLNLTESNNHIAQKAALYGELLFASVLNRKLFCVFHAKMYFFKRRDCRDCALFLMSQANRSHLRNQGGMRCCR